MRIGIDYTPALHQRAGIGRFTKELCQALLSLDATNEYVLVAARGAGPRQSPPLLPPNATWYWLPLSERLMTILWHRLRLPLAVEWLAGPLELFHATDFVLPPLRSAAGIVTVHDLSFLLFPEHFHPNLVRYLRGAVPRALRRARVVIADSWHTRKDLVELLGVSPEKVEVIYGGVGAFFGPVTGEAHLYRVRQRYRLTGPYVLTVGTLQPRKNLRLLLEALALLHRKEEPPPPLLIGGGTGWLYDDLQKEVARLGLQEGVTFLGYVPETDLPALLTMAELFVFPSLYEGFGLPPLEAMACGTPVVCSNAASLPEVVGDAGLLFDPRDPEALAAVLARALASPKLRRELSQRGLARAQEFSWESSAQKLLALYQRLGG